jgi:predicted Zn-dependent peptidase
LDVSANEVAAAVNSHLGRMRMRRVTSIGRAFNLGYDWFSTGSLEADQARSTGLRAVTPEDVARVSERYFAPAPLVKIVVR